MLTPKLLIQGYAALRLKSSLHKFYGHHNLVDRYEILISQMPIFDWTVYMNNTQEQEFTPGYMVGSALLVLLVFCVVLLFVFSF